MWDKVSASYLILHFGTVCIHKELSSSIELHISLKVLTDIVLFSILYFLLRGKQNVLTVLNFHVEKENCRLTVEKGLKMFIPKLIKLNLIGMKQGMLLGFQAVF